MNMKPIACCVAVSARYGLDLLMMWEKSVNREKFYTFHGNSLDKSQVPFTANNEFYSPGAKFDYGGKGLADLQKAGLDLGSAVHEMPPIDQVIAMGKQALGFSG